MKMLAIQVCVLLCTVMSFTLAVDVPGWDRDPIPGAKKGTEAALLQVYEDVLSPELLKALRKEAKVLNTFAKTFGNLKNSKYTTFWKPTGTNAPKARSASEHAVDVMFDILFGKGVGEDGDGNGVGNGMSAHRIQMRNKVVGGKYWYQYRGQQEDVGFHYDKDEGMASDQMIMRFPMYSTVTYIEPKGAPTVILNQTIIKNGNIEVPPIPNEGWFVWPKQNKMMVQRGDLNHGATDKLSARPLSGEEKRITFVVSWEDIKPLEPNCHYIKDNELPKAMRIKPKKSWTLGKDIRRVETTKITPKHSGSKASWHDIPLGRDGSRLHALLPVPRNQQSIPDPHGSYLLSWNNKQVFGQVYELDLFSQSQRRMLFGGGRPAALVFVDAASRKNGRRAMLIAAKEWLSKYGVESMNFFLGDVNEHEAALREFGLKPRDAPIAVIHHVHRNPQVKYIMNRKTTFNEFTSRRLLRFFSKVQKGNVKKMRGKMAHRFEELYFLFLWWWWWWWWWC